MADVVRAEFAATLQENQEQTERLATALTEARAEMREKLAALQDSKDRELDALHERVRSAIAKRDDLITSLRDEAAQERARADHLQEVDHEERNEPETDDQPNTLLFHRC